MPRPPKSARVREAASSAAVGASWMSLVAATTLGLGPVEQLRAHISGDLQDALGCRLIVQSYSKDSLADDQRPKADARPRAATQRAVTADELRRGIEVSVVHVGTGPEDGVVVAWIEPGAPTLEFDGMEARPPSGVYYGVAAREAEAATAIKLRREV